MINQSDLTMLAKGDPVDHFLLVRRIELRSTRTGSHYLSLELGDKSGAFSANVWDNFKELAKGGEVGDVVQVKGVVEEFQNSPQIRVSAIRLSKKSDNVSPQDFLSKSVRNLNEMNDELTNRIKKIVQPQLRTLLENIFTGEELNKFTQAPAGKSWHHGYLHGLLEHTLEIIKICDLMCDIHTDLNRDLLITGAMLHDFGKTEELKYDSAFEYTNDGKLIGHIVMAVVIVKDEIKSIPDFPKELERNLIHLILSHQGKLEYASPVVPKTVEAIVLYQADELSAKVNAYKNVIASEIRGDSQWTKFIMLAQTDLYKHNLENESEGKNNKSLFD
ncbi:MAG: HD domain-containing protein [Ignavibacteria bacterium]|nr:HD domain-containing protein [Ignavibacteria bacterium]MBT8381295.1 HD domain-containing protein [Ignavibacteria bacterium]MBT8390773.1 HD domain-containing protein [Ignavibacteria bacterium]NNJ51988.1 HD domain-containing protein [Ignavibacteriaceae bacterium]NNL20145.1 HD domain-containing protein [Ignavibacteriaceae bacterium]